MVELKIKKDDEEITLVDKEDIEKSLNTKVDDSDLSDYYTKSQSNTEYSINVEKQSTADSGFFSTYVIKQNDVQKGVKINVPKDFLVKSATVKACTTANSPVFGYEVGDKYIDLVINSKDSTDTDEHLYIATKEIGAYPVDEVTLTVDNGKLAIKDNGITWAKLATVVRGIINGKEDINNKVNSVSANSTITQYPSAKCVYDTFCQKDDPRLSDARTPTSHTHSVMDLNNYMPKCNNGGGTAGYLKVLNIKTNQAYLDDPITFEVYQRQGIKPIYCSLKFSGSNNTDPIVSSFKTWGSNNEVYIYKASTNNWEVIVKKIDYYDSLTVENINCNWGRWSAWATNPSGLFTHLDETITSLPSNTSSNPLIKATYDISDVLTDTDTDRCLSANQGKVLKDLVDGKSPKSHTHVDGHILYQSNMINELSALDMAMVDIGHANRLAFMPVANIQVKVSTNGGNTWSDYPSITNDMKLGMVSRVPDETSNLYAGGTTTASANNQIRVILDAGEITSSKNSDVYCSTGKKLMIAFTTNNASGTKVTVDMASYANPTTWVNAKTYDVGGWWGWNSIPFPYIFGGYKGQENFSDHYRYIRLTFTHTGGSGNPIVKAIRLYTPISYVSPSNYAKYGHIYSYDTNQNVTFPAKIIKSGGTSSQFLKADGSIDTNAYLTHANKTEYIYSSHTSSTSAWTGTSSTISSIERGSLIFYRLNQAPTTTNVTLNLTLKNGTTTGAKQVWIGGTRVTNQFPQGSVIMMVYDGSSWIVPNESPTTTPFTVTYTNGTTSTINFVTR